MVVTVLCRDGECGEGPDDVTAGGGGAAEPGHQGQTLERADAGHGREDCHVQRHHLPRPAQSQPTQVRGGGEIN